MPAPRGAGGAAEAAAAQFLARQGLTLICSNYRCRLGEIDLVLRDGPSIVFVEVRLRTNPSFGGAAESISPRKRSRIIAAARHYLAGRPEAPCRFDVVLLAQISLLAGFLYPEAPVHFPELRAGDRLDLVREPDNPHDPNAVRVEWRGRRLGYVPRRENSALAWAMDRGEPVAARISTLRVHRNPRRRGGFEVFMAWDK